MTERHRVGIVAAIASSLLIILGLEILRRLMKPPYDKKVAFEEEEKEKKTQAKATAPKKEAKKKVTMYGASWCGYTRKEKAAIEASGLADSFTVVDCDHTPDYAGCDSVKSFPNFYNCSPGDEGCVPCHRGYSENVADILKKCSA